MFRFLKKKRLAAKGMSCGKTRLVREENPLLDALENGGLMRGAIILAAATILLIYCDLLDANPLRHFLYALLVLSIAVIQPVINGDSVLKGNSRLALFLGLILLQEGLATLLRLQVEEGRLNAVLFPLLVPYALAPMTLSVLLGGRTGLFACLAAALWWAILQAGGDSLPLFLALSGGVVSVLSTLRVRRRSRLLRAGFYSGLAVWVAGIFSGIIGPVVWDAPSLTDWAQVAIGSGAAIGIGILTAVLVSGSLPMLEQIFGITTEISWLEMADLNHPLLRRLSLEAPGTYHHSLAMANLAEACAEKVGANPTLCRVSAYFHDIGKLVKPEYFTENIRAGANPHDDLTPTMSALIILSHVKEGVDLALRNKLNRRVVDAIREHHGTTLVEYFYQRACRQEQEARGGGNHGNSRADDVPKVSEENYRYPGPKPQSIESVILGLADASESASRSLDRPTLQRIDDLVHDILQDRINDGQYDEAPVTLCQLHTIADTLVSSLGSMLHTRIDYRKKEEEGPKPVESEA